MSRQTEYKQNIPNRFLAQLKSDLIFRRIESGIRSLKANRHLFRCCRPGQKNAAVFLGYLAAWVDVGFAGPRVVQQLSVHFDKVARRNLTLINYLPLRMAEGFVAMSKGRHEQAIQYFETVLAFETETDDKELMIITNFWIARCKRIQGRYGDALRYAERAKRAALQMGYLNMHAVIQVFEAWCIFQEGRPAEARKILAEAEVVLQKTDDYVTLGNINSVYGRIAREEGNYDQALHRFASAIEEYKKRDAQHRNVARTLINVALVKRLLAPQLRAPSDRLVANRGARASRTAHEAFSHRKQLERYCREALKHLTEARFIYAQHNDDRGRAKIHIARGYLYLFNGEVGRAASEGVAAYRIVCESNDFALKARARILQSMVEFAGSEKQTGDNGNDGKFSQLSVELAREAVDYANQTQHRSLIAHAYIRLGLAHCKNYSGDWEEAQQCYDKATALLKPKTDHYVWLELRVLKQKLSSAGTIDSRLREWSQGAVGNKTFQQITEDFAAVVIPKVWALEGRKVSRVVERLSISPKKVRRILRAQGLGNGGS
ncbi:MAG: tetratricopeptide repeat protein [Acidobacteria bacterium]|nr:tetratricopeptide repeat protein [Acidobacteriota bacterium]